MPSVETKETKMTKMADFITRFNFASQITGDSPVKRFSDLKAAERRVLAAEKVARDHLNEDTPPAPAIPCVTVTTFPATLANGLPAKDTVHSRRALEQSRGKATPAELPTVASGGIINRANRIVLKDKKELRAELTAAVKALGGTRYNAGGFADSTAFLSGFAFAATTGVGDKARMVITIHPTGASFKPEAGKPSPVAELVIYADGSWKVA